MLDSPYAIAVSRDGKSVYVTVDDGLAVFARNQKTGILTQLRGTNGCVTSGGSGGSCADGKALNSPVDVTVSPDGRNVYVASFFSEGIAVFARDPVTGALAQLEGTDGCVTESGDEGACADGTELWRPTSVTVSPNGRNVYLAASISHAVDVFARDPATGVLEQLPAPDGCVSESGSRGECSDGRGLRGATSVAVTADGKSVYVAAGEGERAPTAGIAIFSRNAKTGALTQPATADGCIDGQFATTPGCAHVPLESPFTIVVSGDGRNAYVGDIYGLTVFARTAGTGALRELGDRLSCDDDVGRVCTRARVLGVGSIALSPNGRSLYVTSENKYALGVFARTTQSGELRQLAGRDGCFSENGSRKACRDGKALLGPGAVAVSPDGLNVYVTSGDSNGAIAVFARRR